MRLAIGLRDHFEDVVKQNHLKPRSPVGISTAAANNSRTHVINALLQQGRKMLILNDDEVCGMHNRPVFSEFKMGGKAERYVIRRGDWKYCHYMTDTPELYNLRDDPEEMRNLATSAGHADVAARLKSELLAWRAR
jgi:arylsulfatase A-like enzyme